MINTSQATKDQVAKLAGIKPSQKSDACPVVSKAIETKPVQVQTGIKGHPMFTPYMKCLRIVEPDVIIQRSAAVIVSASIEAGIFSIIAWFSEPTIRSLQAKATGKPFSFTHV